MLRPQHLQKRLSAATASFRPLLHSRLAVYTDEQQVLVEKQFKQAIHAWASFLEALPLPACLFRRTGQIQAVSEEILSGNFGRRAVDPRTRVVLITRSCECRVIRNFLHLRD